MKPQRIIPSRAFAFRCLSDKARTRAAEAITRRVYQDIQRESFTAAVKLVANTLAPQVICHTLAQEAGVNLYQYLVEELDRYNEEITASAQAALDRLNGNNDLLHIPIPPDNDIAVVITIVISKTLGSRSEPPHITQEILIAAMDHIEPDKPDETAQDNQQ